jgi:hypothetical protein
MGTEFIYLGGHTIKVPERKPIVVSGGVGNNLDFEELMISKYKASVICYDFTIKARQFFESKKRDKRLVFSRFGFSNNNEIKYFEIPDDVKKYSTSEFLSHKNNKNYSVNSAPCYTMPQLVNTYEKVHGRIDILKLDIEGSEYRFLSELKDTKVIKQITGEFHTSAIIPDITEEMRQKLFKHLESIGYKQYKVDELHRVFYV